MEMTWPAESTARELTEFENGYDLAARDVWETYDARDSQCTPGTQSRCYDRAGDEAFEAAYRYGLTPAETRGYRHGAFQAFRAMWSIRYHGGNR